MKVVISSGHGKYVRGASGYIDEVDEARRVVSKVAEYITSSGNGVVTFHDDVSKTQDENLKRIVDYHNSQNRDLDVSVHFNAYQTTSKPMGTECWYVTQQSIADDVADYVAGASGLVGVALTRRFAAEPECEVVVVSRRPPHDLRGARRSVRDRWLRVGHRRFAVPSASPSMADGSKPPAGWPVPEPSAGHSRPGDRILRPAESD